MSTKLIAHIGGGASPGPRPRPARIKAVDPITGLRKSRISVKAAKSAANVHMSGSIRVGSSGTYTSGATAAMKTKTRTPSYTGGSAEEALKGLRSNRAGLAAAYRRQRRDSRGRFA